MERWNGWGEVTREAAVPRGLLALLHRELGPGVRPHDARLDAVVGLVPPSRLSPRDGWSLDPVDRLCHARGQSFPDLIALRAGVPGAFPDAVAHPQSADDVRNLLHLARRSGASIVPYGGGTSVVGGVTTPVSEAPVLTVDMRRVERLMHLDERALLATFGAGVAGPQVEARLRARGLTLGHFPQSFEHSTLGGWVATRSSGQQSLGYGRIEDMFAGGRLESPTGSWELPPFPASAAGPDLRHIVLGAEGRLGILTEATVRIRRLPEVDEVFGAFLPSWDAGLGATRCLAQDGAGLSMLRLSTAEETETSLVLAGRPGVVLGRALELRRLGPGRCLLLIGVLDSARQARMGRRQAAHVVRAQHGVWTGRTLGRAWQRARFRQPYLRNALWERGYGVDTVETATTWTGVPRLLSGLEAALRTALVEPVHVGTHLSHVYRSGSSIYTTFAFRLASTPEQTLERWQRLKDAATGAILTGGGTISHQHGVGLAHREALAVEKGVVGMLALGALTAALDPHAEMNPGKLLR